MRKYQVPMEHYFRMYNKVFDLDLKATTFWCTHIWFAEPETKETAGQA